MWKITDPAKTMERIYENMHWVEKQIAELEANGDPLRLLGSYRKTLRGLKATRTRISRQFFGAA